LINQHDEVQRIFIRHDGILHTVDHKMCLQ